MYIQINTAPGAPALVSRKLAKALGFTGRAPWFLQLTRIRGTDTFIIVPRRAEDTFVTQCSMVVPTRGGNRRTPVCFHWTIPSLPYFLAVTGLQAVGSKIVRAKPIIINQTVYYKLCTD